MFTKSIFIIFVLKLYLYICTHIYIHTHIARSISLPFIFSPVSTGIFFFLLKLFFCFNLLASWSWGFQFLSDWRESGVEKEPGALGRSLSLGRPLTVASSVPFTPSSFKFFQNGLYLWAAKNVPYFFFLCPMSVHDPFFSFFFFKWFVKFCAGDFFFF